MERVGTNGAEMRVDTTARLLALGAPAFAAVGLGLILFASRQHDDLVFTLGIPGAFALAIGLVFTPLRKGLVLDGEQRKVTAWWRWLFLYREAHFAVGKLTFMVERTSTRSKDQGTTYFYRILLGEHHLHTISEHQGDKDGAEALARRMAEHLGTTFAGHQDCRDMKRRDAFRAKYALVPLAATTVIMFGAGLAFLFLGR